MSYTSNVEFDPATGLLSGKLSTGLASPIPPLGDVVVTGYSDRDSVNLTDWFGQCRSKSDGSWVLSTATLSGGPHYISLSFDYGAISATAEITTSGSGAAKPVHRAGLQVNSAPRA